MKFEIFSYKPSDYSLIKGWWEARNFPPANPEFLPPLGLIVTGDSVPICAGFLFKTDAKIAIINHVISSPTPINKDERSTALNHLIARLIYEARESGFKLLTAACSMDKLGERYERHGFTKTDSNENHYGREL